MYVCVCVCVCVCERERDRERWKMSYDVHAFTCVLDMHTVKTNMLF